jgi:hypothetical protein
MFQTASDLKTLLDVVFGETFVWLRRSDNRVSKQGEP